MWMALHAAVNIFINVKITLYISSNNSLYNIKEYNSNNETQ